MTRVLLVGVKHEVNTFVPGCATLDEFRKHTLLEGQAVFGPARGSGQEIDGALEVARESGIELIPTIAAYAGASRPVADEAGRTGATDPRYPSSLFEITTRWIWLVPS